MEINRNVDFAVTCRGYVLQQPPQPSLQRLFCQPVSLPSQHRQ